MVNFKNEIFISIPTTRSAVVLRIFLYI